MPQFNVIGTSPPRLDGREKVLGQAPFIADVPIPGCWVGGVVASPVPHGRIRAIVRDPAFDWSRVVFVDAASLPCRNFVHMVRDDFPILAEEKVTFVTQAVALVAGPDRATVDEALRHVTVDIEPLPAVFSVDEALKGEVVVWGEDNVIDEYRIDRGDVKKAFAEADLVVEGDYATGLHEQLYLENQGMAAIPRDDGSLEIVGSMQCPYYVQGALEQALGLAPERLRVKPCVTGGGFGGKEDYPSVLALWTAVLALKSGRPVRILYERGQDLQSTPKRHPSTTRIRTAVRRDGTITGLEIELRFNGGAFTTLSRVVQQRGMLHCQGAYRIANVAIHSLTVATNMVPSGAYRGFGAPQGLFAIERHMDRIARELALDPLDVRLKNIVDEGDTFPCGQKLKGVFARQVLERAAELSGYRKKRALYAQGSEGPLRRGIGLSVAFHGGGFTGSGEATMGTVVRIDYDGAFSLHVSSTDMGQGALTVLPMIAAEALGLRPDEIAAPRPDTALSPNSGPTVASRTTMYVGRVVTEACKVLVDELRTFLARKEGLSPRAIAFTKGALHCRTRSWTVAQAARARCDAQGPFSVEGRLPQEAAACFDLDRFEGEAYRSYAWIAQAVEVAVNVDTYEVRPLEATVVAEIGRAIHPVLVEGQIAGGFLQALGWSHIEDLTVTPEGRFSADQLNAYLIPTTLDTPRWHVDVMEEPCDVGAYGAKGLGELPMNGAAPAALSAVENATGAFGAEIPLTGEKLFRLIEAQGGTER